MKRRNFLKKVSIATATLPAITMSACNSAPKTEFPKKKTPLPRRRGFNLLNMFLPIGNTFKGSGNYGLGPFQEEDFEIIKSWGFDFIRLPLCYWCWSDEHDWFRLDEKPLKQIDQAVEWGRQYGIHININFHRAPGYCVNPDPIIKPQTHLFRDEAPLEAFCYHWAHFAERYKSYSNNEVSFDLVNEPPSRMRDGYVKAMRAAINAIRAVDPKRLICVDGFKYGKESLNEFADLDNFYQSARGYAPAELTHFRAIWMPDHIKNFPAEHLKWPLHYKDKKYDKQYLRDMYKQGWDEWEKLGGSVHVGEMGCHNHTPAPVMQAWLKDLLDVYKERNWGWACWRLRGALGVIDSNRPGAKYENFRGAKLDREMLEILKQG
jgi:endoglucanase